MGLSLRELKEELIAKGGYTITPNHSQLADLKSLVDDMLNVRSGSPPGSGSGYRSGTTCNGHQAINDYELSLGNIGDLDIKGCSCNSVNDTTAYCRSRTYTCSCNSNTPTCTCNGRTSSSCDCQNRINWPQCSCNSRTCSLVGNTGNVCECVSRFTEYGCTCNSRTSESCNCQSRTSSCGSRNTTSCTCNGRCACNSEKRFE